MIPLLGACLSGYFVYHAIHGDRGILAWLHLNQESKRAVAELARMESERSALERRVTLLSSSSLDRDMLEERARVMLNFTEPDEMVIFLRPEAASPAAQ